MASYTASPINEHRGYDSNNYRYIDWYGWHSQPPLKATGSITFTRDSVDNATVKFTGTIGSQRYTGWSVTYGYPVTAALYVGSTRVAHYNIASTSQDGTNSISISGSFTLDNNNTDVTLHFYCNGGNHEGECSADNVKTPDSVVFKLPAGQLKYEPYKKPTISISTSQQISRFDTSRNISVAANTSGDDNTTTVSVNVNDRGYENTNIGNNSGTYSFVPNNKKVTNGKSYSVVARRVHNSNSSLSATSNKLTLYTYRTPIINQFKITPTSFSGTGNTTFSWNTNGRRWQTSLESNFKTYFKFATDNQWFESSNHNPNTGDTDNAISTISQLLSQSIINSHMSVQQRSNEVVSTTVQAKRVNVSSGVEVASSSISVTVQFKPKYRPDINTDVNSKPRFITI